MSAPARTFASTCTEDELSTRGPSAPSVRSSASRSGVPYRVQIIPMTPPFQARAETRRDLVTESLYVADASHEQFTKLLLDAFPPMSQALDLSSFLRALNNAPARRRGAGAAMKPEAEDYETAGVFAVDIPAKVISRRHARVALAALTTKGPDFSPFDSSDFDDDE